MFESTHCGVAYAHAMHWNPTGYCSGVDFTPPAQILTDLLQRMSEGTE